MEQRPDCISRWVLCQWDRENNASNDKHITVENEIAIGLNKLVQLNQLGLCVIVKRRIRKHGRCNVEYCTGNDSAVDN